MTIAYLLKLKFEMQKKNKINILCVKYFIAIK
jgi:hypothetical protein